MKNVSKIIFLTSDLVALLFLLAFTYYSNGFVLEGSTKECVFYLNTSLTDGFDTHNSLVLLILTYGAYTLLKLYEIKSSFLINLIIELILLIIFFTLAYLLIVYASCSVLLTVYSGNYSLLAFLIMFFSLRIVRIVAITKQLGLFRKTETSK